MSSDLDQPPIRAPGQLGLTLTPGKRQPGRPCLTWKSWSPAEQLAIDMNDTVGSYSTGRYVEEARS